MFSDRPYAVITAPSCLGLWPSGVEQLPTALQEAGLVDGLSVERLIELVPPTFSDARDASTHLRNGPSIASFAQHLSNEFGKCLREGFAPTVLGGDCSILLGPMLALRQIGRYGLLFLDGHCDFCDPEHEPRGEAASMDLSLATGRGPEVVANLDGYPRLVEDGDVVQFGFRAFDDDTEAFNGLSIYDTDIEVFDLPRIRSESFTTCLDQALARVASDHLDGFFVHVDCDVLDDAVMPAVDYRSPGGLSFEELSLALRGARATGRMVGAEFTIFNPTLDKDGSIAANLTHALVEGLTK